ncbi:hypothetical protein BDF14DRAFT_1741728 [Spinellus fusiger]|nr:hypothetical protein BDF14DRAFT_1741728 [Spinellus fusiger]
MPCLSQYYKHANIFAFICCTIALWTLYILFHSNHTEYGDLINHLPSNSNEILKPYLDLQLKVQQENCLDKRALEWVYTVSQTEIESGHLTEEEVSEALKAQDCFAPVYDLSIGLKDELPIDRTPRFTFFISQLRPRIVIHVQDSVFDEHLSMMRRIDTTTVIHLPILEIQHALWVADLSIHALQLITDRRPDSLLRLLESANTAYFLGDSVDLVLHTEQTADQATLRLVDHYQWRQGSKILRHRIQKGGLMADVVESWYPNNNHNYAVLLEDDVEVSPLFYCWAKYTLLKYRSWKKYFIELVYARAYVMLYPNFKEFESFSTNHLQMGTHIRNPPSQGAVDSFNVPLMVKDALLEQLPDQRLPDYETLPVFTLWGQRVSHKHMDEEAAQWYQTVSSCPRQSLAYTPQDLFCPLITH